MKLLLASQVRKKLCDECGEYVPKFEDPLYTVCAPCDKKLYTSGKNKPESMWHRKCQYCNKQLPKLRYYSCFECTENVEVEDDIDDNYNYSA